MLGDLKNQKLIVLKAFLFVLLGLLAGVLLLRDQFTLRDASLLLLCIWAFCRAYYFLFYVIGSYLDPSYKYSGLLSAFRHLLTKRTPSSPPSNQTS